MLKKMRLDEPSSSRTLAEPSTQEPTRHVDSRPRRATVEDAPEDEDQVDTSFAPGGDADYYVEEDEEGRFYGGGLTREQKDILSVFEKAEMEGVSNQVCPRVRRVLYDYNDQALFFSPKRSRSPVSEERFCGWSVR